MAEATPGADVPYSDRVLVLRVMRIGAALALVLLLAWIGVALRCRPDGLIPIWPANGLLLALLLITTARWEKTLYLLWGMLAYALMTGLSGLPTIMGLRTAASNGAELAVGMLLLQRFIGRDTELSEPEDLWRFALFAAVIPPATGAIVSGLLRVLLGQPRSIPILLSFFLAHGVGIITITPLALAVLQGRLATFHKRKFVHGLVAFVILAAVSALVFWQARYPLLFLILPPLVALVCIGGLPSGALGLFLITGVSFGLTSFGHGPAQLVAGAGQIEKITLLQGFTATASCLALVLAVVLAERDRALAALEAARRDLEFLCTIDSVTNLANRRKLDEFFENEFRRAMRQGTPLTLLLLDIDHFKLFNDHYGHPAGDACLRAVGDALRDLGRRPGDLSARYGGEEFAIVLGADAQAAVRMAEAARAAIQQLRIPHAGNEAGGKFVTVSIGAATLSAEHRFKDRVEMLQEADQMLYEAKRTGRNRVVARLCMEVSPSPPPIADEARRAAQVARVLARLRGSRHPDLQAIAAQAAELMATPIAAVSLVTQENQVFTGSCGLSIDQTSRDVSFCAHTITGVLPLVILDATRDPRFAGNSLVTDEPFVRFYVGAPIVSRSSGHRLGAVCAIDHVPHQKPTDDELEQLGQLAAQAAEIIDREMAVAVQAPEHEPV